MILGNIDNFKGIGLVAFLDILGFANEISIQWDEEESDLLPRILELKESLHNREIPDKEKKVLSYTKYFLNRIQTISDSIVVSYGFDEDLSVGDIRFATYSFLDNISFIWRKCLELGFTIRGALIMEKSSGMKMK